MFARDDGGLRLNTFAIMMFLPGSKFSWKSKWRNSVDFF